MKKQKSLAFKMTVGLIAGLVFGLIMIAVRESMGGTGAWLTINRLLFADITAAGNEQALGLFYLIGQIFVRALQVVIIPMVFTSIVLAMVRISDAAKLGRIASKTVGFFLLTTVIGILVASVCGMIAYNAGAFSAAVSVESSTGSTGSNPLNIILNAVPTNFATALSNNGGVLAIVVLAVAVGLAVNTLGDKIKVIKSLCQEISDIIVVYLNVVVNKLGPIAIFCLISRTCAAYGIAMLKPAAAYMILTIILLLLALVCGYSIFVKVTTGLNPKMFVKKMAKVAMFGFSTSSSAATLPLNMRAAVDEIGVEDEVASFVLPLGMTINMDGTAIMQVVATLFVAGVAGIDVTIPNLIVIGILTIIASVGTPAAPGAGAVVLFTILSGVGFTTESAMMAYTIILAINRPIEMLVTALNVVGDTSVAMAVAKSENALDTTIYEAEVK